MQRLSRVDDDHRRGGRVVGEDVVLGAAGQRDVTGVQPGGSAALADDGGAAVRLADQRQRRIVADAHRPRWIHHHPQHECASRSHTVEQADHGVHRRSLSSRRPARPIAGEKHLHACADVGVDVDARQHLRPSAEQRLVDAPADDEEREMLCGNGGFGRIQQAPIVQNGRSSRRTRQASGPAPARSTAARARAPGWLRRPRACATARPAPAAPAQVVAGQSGQVGFQVGRVGQTAIRSRNGVTVLSNASFTIASSSSCLSPKCL